MVKERGFQGMVEMKYVRGNILVVGTGFILYLFGNRSKVKFYTGVPMMQTTVSLYRDRSF